MDVLNQKPVERLTWHIAHSEGPGITPGPTYDQPWFINAPTDEVLILEKIRLFSWVIKTGPPQTHFLLTTRLWITNSPNAPVLDSMPQQWNFYAGSGTNTNTPESATFMFTPDNQVANEAGMVWQPISGNIGYTIRTLMFDQGGYQFLATDVIGSHLYLTFRRPTKGNG